MPEGNFESPTPPEKKTDWSYVEKVMREKEAREIGKSSTPAPQQKEETGKEETGEEGSDQVVQEALKKNEQRKQEMLDEYTRLQEILRTRSLTPEELERFRKLTI